MERVYNFNPGPAALPLEVLEEARQTFVEYGEQGMSLLEMSHRSREAERMIGETAELLTEALGLPAGYRILFMGGGASAQFALVPMNFLSPGRTAGYVLSGSFSEKAYQEARLVGDAEVLASSKAHGWRSLPEVNRLSVPEHAAYVHMTTNNTIEGSQFRDIPDTGSVPLIGDMTSDILSRKLDWTKFAMFYASAQKNLGPAGVTVVVIRDDLLQACTGKLPAILRYSTFGQHDSLYNTPPVHAIYMMNLVLRWTMRQGGIAALEERNAEKAGLLYEVIDASGGFYEGVVDAASRSMMNVTWKMQNGELERRFVEESKRHGFAGLAGHRSVGGLRASAYNAVGLDACRALAEFMADFQMRRG